MAMDCNEARTHLLDRRRGALPENLREQVDAHLADCASCRQEDAADRELSSALERNLLSRQAPPALKRSLEARWLDTPARPRVSRVRWAFAGLVAGAALAAIALVAWQRHTAHDAMLAEAVNDHLRVLYSERPVEVEGPDTHKVKPWFAGRLDFAPVTAFGGDDDFPLEGGAVSYFVDRKAAALVFHRRLHVITLLIFRADGLPWAFAGLRPIGQAKGTLQTSRGFHVLLWREGDLGYALVSDLDERELAVLGAKVAGQ
jgi:anti-sigma factor RsiW